MLKSGMLCCAVLCHAVTSWAILCHAVPCCVTLGNAVPCCAMLCIAKHVLASTLQGNASGLWEADCLPMAWHSALKECSAQRCWMTSLQWTQRSSRSLCKLGLGSIRYTSSRVYLLPEFVTVNPFSPSRCLLNANLVERTTCCWSTQDLLSLFMTAA